MSATSSLSFPPRSILHWNCRSLPSKLAEVSVFLSRHQPMLLALTETWPGRFPKPSLTQRDQPYASLRVHNYTFVHAPLPPSLAVPSAVAVNSSSADSNAAAAAAAVTGGGGIGVYIHNSIPHTVLSSHSFTSTVTPSQLFWLRVNTPSPLLLGVVYLHPAATATDRRQLCDALRTVADTETTPCLVLGDFNAHHQSWHSLSNSANGTAIADFLHDSHWDCVNATLAPHRHTHVSHAADGTVRTSIIDLALASHSDLVASMSIRTLSPLASDHVPLQLTVNSVVHAPVPPLSLNQSVKYNIPVSRVTDSAVTRARHSKLHIQYTEALALNLQDWWDTHGTVNRQHLAPDCTVQQAVDSLYGILDSTATAVYGTVPVLPASKRAHRWYHSHEVRAAIADHHSALQQWQYHPTEANSQRRQETKRVRDKTVRSARWDDWKRYIETLQTEDGKLDWTVWHSSQGSSGKGALANIADVHGVLPATAQQSLGNLADHYSRVCDSTAVPLGPDSDFNHTVQSCLNTNSPHYPASLPCASTDSLFTLSDVLAGMKRVSLTTSLGPDRLHGSMLRYGGSALASVLTVLVNAVYRTGHVPVQWRNANICSLFKKGSRTEPSNYRPISVTSVLARMVERLIQPRLLAMLEPQLHASQYGFRPRRSTCDALSHVLQRIHYVTRVQKQRLPVVNLDLSKAFDRVNHDILLYKLHAQFGVSGQLWAFIKGFLADRVGRTVDGDIMSDWRPMTAGVPQGTVLGPVLFIAYNNDLLNQISVHSFCEPIAFADDVTLVPYSPLAHPRNTRYNYSHMTWAVQQACDIAHRWALRNRMQWNAAKSTLTVFRASKADRATRRDMEFDATHGPILPSDIHPISLAGVPLPVTPTVCLLGLTLSSTLDWQPHFESVLRKTRTATALVTRLVSARLSVKHATTLVNLCIRSVFSYGFCFWSPTAAQCRRFDSCMALPLRRAMGLPISAHVSSVLSAAGVPCASAIWEHLVLRSVHRVIQLPHVHPARGVLQASANLPLRTHMPAKARLVSHHAHKLLQSGHWGPPSTLQQLIDDPTSHTRTHKQLYDCMMKRAYQHWMTDTRHPGGHYMKYTYLARSDGTVKRERSLDFDTPEHCHARARLRHTRTLTLARRHHEYTPNSAQFSDSDQCRSGDCHVPETNTHVFLECPRFDSMRYALTVQLSALLRGLPLSSLTLPLLTGHVPPTLPVKRLGKWFSLTAAYILAVSRAWRL